MAEIRGGILIYREPAIGDVDSINTIFTSQYPFVPTTLRVFLNGLEQILMEDYDEIDNQTIQFVTPPVGGEDADTVQLNYQRS